MIKKATTKNETMNRSLRWLLVLIVTLLLPQGAWADDVWSGEGTKDNPYVITTTAGLDSLAKRVNNGNEYAADEDHPQGYFFELGADIDYTNAPKLADGKSNYTAIGYSDGLTGKYFSGHFDGKGHTIKGIRIYKEGHDNEYSYQGLFSNIYTGGSVSHVILDDAYIIGFNQVGGIVGWNYKGTITDCHVTASVSIHAVQSDVTHHGGIAGYNNDGTISGCTSKANITVEENTDDCNTFGGIVGRNEEHGTIENCLYLGGQVAGYQSIGAIVGYNDGTVKNCYFTDSTFEGKKSSGTAFTLANGNPAIGLNNDGSVTNTGLARVITLGEGVVIGGTATDYAEDVENPARRLTAYSIDNNAFALRLDTLNGTKTDTIYYSVKDAEVLLSENDVPDGYDVAYTAKNTSTSDDITATAISGETLTMPDHDVTVGSTLEDLWGVAEGANGTWDNPYVITTPAGLNLLAKNVNGGRTYKADDSHLDGYIFVLGNDIEYQHTTAWNDATSTENNYTPIGYVNGSSDYVCFQGILDGRGHTVSGIRIYRDGADAKDVCQGLFGYISNGCYVADVILDDARIAGYQDIGGIVGRSTLGVVLGCNTTDRVCIHAVTSGAYSHGGIIGGNNFGFVHGCLSKASITASNGVEKCIANGGIAGTSLMGKMKDNLYLGGAIAGDTLVGAIVGWSYFGTIQNCYYTDSTVEGIDADGEAITLNNGNPAIGYDGSDGLFASEVIRTGLARVITFTRDAAMGGKPLDYFEDVENPKQHIIAYGDGELYGDAFALRLDTLNGTKTDTIYYSIADAEVSLTYTGTTPEGISPTILVKTADGDAIEVTEDNNLWTFTMPAADVEAKSYYKGSIGYAVTSLDKSKGDASFINELTVVGDGEVTYSLTGNPIATVDEKTGRVTIKDAPGVFAIIATVEDGEEYVYETTTASYSVNTGLPITSSFINDDDEPAIVACKLALETVLKKAKEIDATENTTESAMALEEAIDNAEDALAKKDVTIDELETARVALLKAIDELEKMETTGLSGKSGLSGLSGDYYDLQGRKVKSLKKGIYIYKGKKVKK